MSVTVTISTKDRYYTTLPMVLYGIINQSVTPDKLILFDDGLHLELRRETLYQDIFSLLNQKYIKFQIVYSPHAGQVANHQKALEMAETDFIWRLDDDTVPEHDVLHNLLLTMQNNDKLGAVAGIVLAPNSGHLCPSYVTGKIADINMGLNLQWFRHPSPEPIDVEHLYSTFLYRKAAASHGYHKELSPVGHREETMFSYEMFRAGWSLKVLPNITTWHLKQKTGGIRSFHDNGMWAHDEQIFIAKLSEWGIHTNKYKIIVLDNGVGDHYAFKHIINEVKDKYSDHKIILSVCNPEVFEDIDNVEIVSIADIKMMSSNIDRYNIYVWMERNQWKGSLIEAMRRMYLS